MQPPVIETDRTQAEAHDIDKPSPERKPEPSGWASSEGKFSADDETQLFYRVWKHEGSTRRTTSAGTRCLVLFHGGHEHSGRFDELVRELGLEEFTVFAPDARGHGRSPGVRGDAEHFGQFVKDAESFLRFIEREYGFAPEDTVVLGHSVGSVVVATWLLDWAPRVRGAVLSSPAFRIKLYIPFALTGLRALEKVRPGSHVSSYVRPTMLTHDRAEAEARRTDPLISPRISVRVLTSLFDTSRRVVRDAAAIETPVLLLTAGADYVVRKSEQRRFFARLPSPHKRHVELPGFYHEVLHEAERAKPIAETREFIRGLFDSEPVDLSPAPTLLTQSEDFPDRPLPTLSLRRVFYGAQRLFLKTVGRLSDGIRLGWRRGFDSGSSLDYVYRNQPSGRTPLGRLIDRFYLRSAGWNGIRQRRRDLTAITREAAAAALSERRRARLVDLASGPGRYLHDVLASFDGDSITVLARDRDEAGLEEGRKLARAAGLETIRYEQGDAFDSESIASLSPRPDVVIVSGLWELFPDNERVLESLRGIREALPVGGSIVYTNQPHHPQLEFIARVLTNREGRPWVMRLRKQAELDRLVRLCGFRKAAMRIDDAGIFTVSRAVKVD